MAYFRSLSPGVIAAIVILVVLLLVAIALAIYFGIRSNNTGNVNPTGLGPTGATGPVGPTGATGSQGATGPAGGFTSTFGTPWLYSSAITIPSTFPSTLSIPLPFTVVYPSNYTVDISLPNNAPFFGSPLTVYPPSDSGSALPLRYTTYIAGNILYVYIYSITSPVTAGNTATVTLRAILGSAGNY
jgi:hypothetical protein